MRRFSVCLLATVAAIAAHGAGGGAGGGTSKGLNQIITPDIQPLGMLSWSLQYEHPIIGNYFQSQYELGLTKQFEVSLFQGMEPGQEFLFTELGLIQDKHWLLSTGFLGWGSNGQAPQPFVEAGYYTGNLTTMLGLQRQGHVNQAVAGIGYQTTQDLKLQLDYQSGQQNFATAGFTYNITKNLQINPAIYMANSSDHKLYPYVVLTWNITAFK